MKNFGNALYLIGSLAFEVDRMVRLYGIKRKDAELTVQIILATANVVR